MAQFRRIKRPVSGVLLLDKPAGISSNQALQQVKRLYAAEKAGHTGSLDPFATGLLPLCFGEATKFSHFLLDADKAYEATLHLGATSSTGDTEGEIVTYGAVTASREQVLATLSQFLGSISQVPPMYSALKHQGRALYEYARAGVEIERAPRQIWIRSLELESYDGTHMRIRVACSKGTYIRTLAEDIGRALGCGAYLTQLRRTLTGGFTLAGAVTVAQLEAMEQAERDACLLPADALLRDFPEVALDEASAHYFCNGQPVWKSGVGQAENLRVYDAAQRFIGLGEAVGDGRVAPRRVVRQAAESEKNT